MYDKALPLTGVGALGTLTGSVTLAIVALALVGAGFALYRVAPRIRFRNR